MPSTVPNRVAFLATTGGIKLASNHTNEVGDSINMGKVAVLDKIDEAVFTDAAKPLP